MATITIDARRVADKLKSAGFSAEQAETVVRVIAEAQQDLVTVKDLDASLSPLKTDLAVLMSEVGQMKWMLGFVMGGIIAVLAKLLSQLGSRPQRGCCALGLPAGSWKTWGGAAFSLDAS